MLDDNTVLDRLSANIAGFMALHHLSQRELARKTGETEMFISRILRQSHMPNVASMSRIAEALDVSVDQLLAEPPKKIPKSA